MDYLPAFEERLFTPKKEHYKDCLIIKQQMASAVSIGFYIFSNARGKTKVLL